MIEKPHRIVLDTNIIISGFLQPKSIPAQAMIAAFRNGEILLSAAVLAEFQEVLSRTKFNHHSDLEVRLRYLASLKNAATLVEIIDFVHDCRDPRDDKFLELVLNGHANVLIAGDQDLLTLHPWRGVPILSPADYLAQTARVAPPPRRA